jgi:hypothetical protein
MDLPLVAASGECSDSMNEQCRDLSDFTMKLRVLALEGGREKRATAPCREFCSLNPRMRKNA